MLPHKFVWKATFDKFDKEPFGSYVFDDIVSSSIDGYTVTDRTFYRIAKEDTATCPQAFLITERNVDFTNTDIEYLYQLLHAGNQVMICTNYFSSLEDTLCFETGYNDYFPTTIGKHIQQKRSRDSLFFGTDTLHPEYICEVHPEMHVIYLIKSKKKWVHKHSDSDSTGLVNDTLPAQENATEYEKYFRSTAIQQKRLYGTKKTNRMPSGSLLGKANCFWYLLR
jgi:hypothetical protein